MKPIWIGTVEEVSLVNKFNKVDDP